MNIVQMNFIYHFMTLFTEKIKIFARNTINTKTPHNGRPYE